MKKNPKTNLQTKQQLLLEVEELRTRLDATERRLREASEILQAQIVERKRVEQTFEEAREYAESIINTVREPLIALDQDLRVVSVSRSFYKVFKVKTEETVGQLIYDLGNKQWDIPKLRELLETILPEKATFDNYEVEHDFATIGWRTMLLNARQIQRVLGKERIILLAIEDITERREVENGMERARKELEATKISEHEAREYAESIINTVREPLIALDQDLRVVSVSRSFYKVFKVKTEETVGQLIYDLGNKQWDIPKLRELLETILPEKATFDNYEVEHDFATIGWRTMLLNARQIQRVLGKERIILLAIEDITERRRLEILLSESEERYRRLFETANDGILLLEKREGNITHANPAVTAMLGYSKEECIGNKLQDIGFSHDTGHFQEIMQTLDRSGIIYYDDVPIKTKAGQTFYVDIYLVDRARLVQCNIRDITERKQAEEALRKSERELKSKTENLEEVNTALNILLKRVEEGRIGLEEKILANIRELVLPYIDRLKKTQLSDHQASYLIVIETNLDNIASSFLYHLKMRYLNLTHREVQVASLVKEGKPTKEIAKLLNIAIKTVAFHRNSLRKKLALKNQKANLRARLLTFT